MNRTIVTPEALRAIKLTNKWKKIECFNEEWKHEDSGSWTMDVNGSGKMFGNKHAIVLMNRCGKHHPEWRLYVDGKFVKCFVDITLTMESCDIAKERVEEFMKTFGRIELTREQIGFAIKAMSSYTRILEEQKKGSPTPADIDHSALLNRLLSGKEPFPEPPPLFYGYPCYELEEGEQVVVGSIFHDRPNNRVAINQSRDWEPETELGSENTGVVVHIPTGKKYLLYRGSYEAWTLQEDRTRMMQQHPALMIRKINNV